METKSGKDNFPKIRGDLLKKAREDRAIEIEELAVAVCLNKRHIFQLEDSLDFHYFYTLGIKVQSAKKVGNYLGLSEDEYLEYFK